MMDSLVLSQDIFCTYPFTVLVLSECVSTNEVQITVDSNFSELPLKACDYGETHKRKL